VRATTRLKNMVSAKEIVVARGVRRPVGASSSRPGSRGLCERRAIARSTGCPTSPDLARRDRPAARRHVEVVGVPVIATPTPDTAMRCRPAAHAHSSRPVAAFHWRPVLPKKCGHYDDKGSSDHRDGAEAPSARRPAPIPISSSSPAPTHRGRGYERRWRAPALSRSRRRHGVRRGADHRAGDCRHRRRLPGFKLINMFHAARRLCCRCRACRNSATTRHHTERHPARRHQGDAAGAGDHRAHGSAAAISTTWPPSRSARR